MNSKNLAAYIQLSRPVNVAITFVSIPVACWIAGGTASSWVVMFLAGLTGAFVAAGANAVNDFFDIEIDRINRPDRPLPRGALVPQDAWRMWSILSLASLTINIFINFAALAVVILSIVLLYVYSARLKKTILVGNVVVGLMTGMAFIYGGVVMGAVERAIVPAIFAFLVNLARELLKDVEDMEGDRKGNAITLPIQYGVRTALTVATGSLLLLTGVTVGVALSSWYHPAFFYVVLLADCCMGASIGCMWLDPSAQKYLRRASILLKTSMMIGLLSIIAGSL
jgi:geranylgeranylglycerol-phosphate geranylgeranyltransferase